MSPIAPRPARVDLLLRATDPTAPCVAFGDLRWTYAELDAAVDAAASRLAAAGLRPGDRIAVLSTPRPEYLLLWLAASRIGAVYVGLNPRYTARELSVILARVRPRLVFSLRAFEGADLPAVLDAADPRAPVVPFGQLARTNGVSWP